MLASVESSRVLRSAYSGIRPSTCADVLFAVGGWALPDGHHAALCDWLHDRSVCPASVWPQRRHRRNLLNCEMDQRKLLAHLFCALCRRPTPVCAHSNPVSQSQRRSLRSSVHWRVFLTKRPLQHPARGPAVVLVLLASSRSPPRKRDSGSLWSSLGHPGDPKCRWG